MGQDPVFHDHHRRGGVGVAQEEGVVAHAQADDDVEVGALGLQLLGLEDGVAHGLVSAAAVQFLLVGNADDGFIHSTQLAADGVIFDAQGLENFGKDPRLRHQPHAGGDADLLVAHAPDELNGFFHAGQAAVKLALDPGGDAGDVSLFRVLLINFQGFLQSRLILLGGQAEGGVVGLVLGFAGEDGAVGAGVDLCVSHGLSPRLGYVRNVCGGVGVGYVVIKGVDVVGELLGVSALFQNADLGQLLHAELDGVIAALHGGNVVVGL